MRKIQTRMLRQDLAGATKRWYTDDGGDLFTWTEVPLRGSAAGAGPRGACDRGTPGAEGARTDKGGRLMQFQWGFRHQGRSWLLEWKRGGGTKVFKVSDEENLAAATGGMKPSPTMQPLPVNESAGLREIGQGLLLARIGGLPDSLTLALRLALEDVAP